MTVTSKFDIGEGLDSHQTCQWDTKCKLFSLEEVFDLSSAVLVCFAVISAKYLCVLSIVLFPIGHRHETHNF